MPEATFPCAHRSAEVLELTRPEDVVLACRVLTQMHAPGAITCLAASQACTIDSRDKELLSTKLSMAIFQCLFALSMLF